MPLYEYICERCDSQFELLIRSSNDRPACPSCGTEKIAKQLSVPAAHVGGTGSLPICDTPRGMPAGGCGAPQCGMGSCMGM